MKKDINKILDEQEFYELMQDYRNAPFERTILVIECFENVKQFIKDLLKE